MIKFRHTFICMAFCCTVVFLAHAQNGPLEQDVTQRFIPKTPQAASFDEYINTPVNYATGIPDISVPLHVIETKELQIPLSVSYHASGIRVQDIASSVGLKWSLNTGGMISRNIYGVADETPIGMFNISDGYHEQACTQTQLKPFYDGELDTSPDIFTYHFMGKSGEFILHKAGTNIEVIKSKEDEVKIIPIIDGYNLIAFEAYDEFGNKYFFSDIERTETRYSTTIDNTPSQPIEWLNGSGSTGWMLSSISTPFNELIRFYYKEYNYSIGSIFQHTGFTYTTRTTNDPICPTCPAPITSSSGMSVIQGSIEYWVQLLDSITTAHQVVSFVHSDIIPTLSIMQRKLTQINVKEKSTRIIKKIDLHHSTYSGDSRLKLIGIDICAPNAGGDTKKFTFSYKDDQFLLPGYNSHSKDVFGYQNGNTEFHSIPVNPSNLTYFPYTPANRNIDPTVAQRGVLNRVTYPSGGSIELAYEVNREVVGNEVRIAPGLRVKSIDYTDETGRAVKKETFAYSTIAGVFEKEGDYWQHYEATYQSDGTPPRVETTYRWTVNPISRKKPNMGYWGGFYYSQVVQNNCKSNGDVDSYSIFSYNENREVYSYKPYLQKQELYRNDGFMVKSIDFTYENTQGNPVLFKAYTPGESYVSNESYLYWHDCNGNYPSSFMYYAPLDQYTYYMNTSWMKKTETVSEFYPGNQPTKYIKVYTYNENTLPKSVLTSYYSGNDKFRQDEISIKYPTDYPISDYPLFPQFQQMVDNRIIGVKVDEKQYIHQNNVEKLVVAGMVKNYNMKGQPVEVFKWNGASPSATATLTGQLVNSEYSLESSYTYDSITYNLLNAQRRSDMIVFLWGYNQRYPIAKVVNADISNVAFSSFETDEDKGGWNYQGNKVLEPETSPTGLYNYNIYSGWISRDIQPGTYELSYWLKGGSITISGGTVSEISQTDANSNGWVMYSKKIVAPSSGTLTITSGPNTFIDELRFHPIDSQMETYTYDPGIGVTSTTDPNGLTTYYEYDGLGRLVRVRDHESNIIKEYEYHYAQ